VAWFKKDFIAFFLELEANNHKEWFHENKERYEKFVKEPFYDFVSEMISRLQKDDPEIAIPAKDAIFRIYRDVRFSKNKTPYKTNTSAIISAGGRKDFTRLGIYLELKASGVQFYGGAHHLEKEQLFKVRTAIMKNPAAFNKVINAKGFKENFGEVQGAKNKRLPKEFSQAAETNPLLFNKNFYYGCQLGTEYLLKDNLADIIFDLYKAGKPFNTFFNNIIAK
jgi:uncharacterized protein (TIGR02453 family)